MHKLQLLIYLAMYIYVCVGSGTRRLEPINLSRDDEVVMRGIMKLISRLIEIQIGFWKFCVGVQVNERVQCSHQLFSVGFL